MSSPSRPGSSIDLSFLTAPAARKRLAAFLVLGAVGGVLYWVFAPKWYRSTVTVVPAASQKSPGIAGMLGGDLGGLAAGLGASMGSGIDVPRIAVVLQSVAVADAVIAKFDLASRYGQKHQELVRDELWGHCEVKTLPKPGLVQLSCEDRDPRFVQQLLTYFTEVGNEVFRKVNVSSASEEVRYLERRVVELRQQSDLAASRMRDFQEKHKIVDLDSQAKAVVSALAGLQGQRITKQMELGYARTFSARNEATARQLESQLEIVEERLRDLESSDMPSPGPGEGRAGRGSGPGVFPSALAVPKLRAEFEALYRDRKVADATLLYTLDRLEGARASEARDVSSFQVLDPSTIPTRRARPRGLASVATGALLSLSVGVILEWVRARGKVRRDEGTIVSP
ncbi:MAG: hypothetical protein WB493_05690 [Anaeromyxobacteraceae bacterium]